MTTKFGTDVSNFFNRTLQKAEEAFATGEKTVLDSSIEQMTQDCHIRQKWVNSLIGLVDAVAEPNPANRVEDKVLQTMDRKKARTNDHAKLGESFVSIGERVDQRSPLGTALNKAGQCEISIGNAANELHQAIDTNYTAWLRDYLQNYIKPALTERENLDNTRLDLDRAKTLLKRAGNDQAKKQKHEQQVTESQTLFDRQVEVTKRQLQATIDEFDKHKDALRQLLIAQRDYHEKCVKAVETALN